MEKWGSFSESFEIEVKFVRIVFGFEIGMFESDPWHSGYLVGGYECGMLIWCSSKFMSVVLLLYFG